MHLLHNGLRRPVETILHFCEPIETLHDASLEWLPESTAGTREARTEPRPPCRSGPINLKHNFAQFFKRRIIYMFRRYYQDNPIASGAEPFKESHNAQLDSARGGIWHKRTYEEEKVARLPHVRIFRWVGALVQPERECVQAKYRRARTIARSAF